VGSEIPAPGFAELVPRPGLPWPPAAPPGSSASSPRAGRRWQHPRRRAARPLALIAAVALAAGAYSLRFESSLAPATRWTPRREPPPVLRRRERDLGAGRLARGRVGRGREASSWWWS
jgi:hypothetical protein